MKQIMISIRPEWVEKILNGEKTLEIRKSMPKCGLPCKVYIYCTKSKKTALNNHNGHIFTSTPNWQTYSEINGKVVAEFTLNEIENVDVPYPAYLPFVEQPVKNIAEHSCLTLYDLHKYLGTDRGYAWHIDDLKIYDKPKELSEFKVYDKTYDTVGAFGWAFSDEQKYTPLRKPPQSWCYIEGENK